MYGVVGRLDTTLCRNWSLRVGVYGHFAPLHWSQVFDGSRPRRDLLAGQTKGWNQHQSYLSTYKEARQPCPTTWTTTFLLDNPWITVVGTGGTGGTGGFVAEGLCRLFQGRDATIVLVDHDRVEPHNLLRQNFYADDVGTIQEPGPGRPAGSKPTTGPWATRSIPSGRRTAATPAFLSTTAWSSAAPTMLPLGGPWPSACSETLPLAHRLRQRHQLGPGAGWECR